MRLSGAGQTSMARDDTTYDEDQVLLIEDPMQTQGGGTNKTSHGNAADANQIDEAFVLAKNTIEPNKNDGIMEIESQGNRSFEHNKSGNKHKKHASRGSRNSEVLTNFKEDSFVENRLRVPKVKDKTNRQSSTEQEAYSTLR